MSDLFYTCPMHPEIKQDDAGICPECGMNLIINQKDHPTPTNGHDKHASHSTRMFLQRFWISLVLTIPIVLYSDLLEKILGWQAPEFAWTKYLLLILASIVFIYGGWVFIASAIRELKAKLPGMMTLIALAISAAYFYSLYAVFLGKETLFWELATLITIMLLGHYLEMKAVSSAQSALRELSKLLPDQAEVVRDGKTQIIALNEVRISDVVLVKPGGKIPTDGQVIDGQSDVDESIVTGESKPVIKNKSDQVIAGTINGDGALKIKVTKIGQETFLAGVMKLVAQAQSSKSKLQILSDRAAFYLTLIAISIGGITLISWILAGDTAIAIERMVAVLVIACPHALGLAVPLVASISTTKAARNGFLIKQRLALEAARNIGVVLFDKTGTLTLGEFGVDKVIAFKSGQEKQILQYAASVNQHSEHPIARAIIAYANKQRLALSSIKNFQRLPGKGASAKITNNKIIVGSQVLLDELHLKVADNFKSDLDQLSSQGKTIIFVIKDQALLGAIALVDIIREESRLAIDEIRRMGIKTAMITGDSEDVARWVAQELKIDEFYARVLPAEKSARIKALQAKNQKVAFVGDGVNDAPALTQADLGIAIGAGTNVAIESAGIILVKNDPRDIAKIIKLSRLTYTKMIQNLFWATGYNVVAIPLAAGILVSQGIVLEPAVAALFMSISTVIVAFNALLLNRQSL